MLYSVAQCNEALERIDFELKRLALERQQVLEMKELLEKAPGGTEEVSHNPYYNPELRIGTRMQKILQIISEHPGINGRDVKEIFGPEAESRQIQTAINRLKKKNLIENRGAHGLGAAWYIKEN
jgi:hypothetical protein